MELKKISSRVVIVGTLVIWAIKYFIRPNYLLGLPNSFFLNVAPNLIGSFLIPFGAYWFFTGRTFLLARIFRISSLYDLQFVCLLGFAMLVINEYLQRLSLFGRTFDYYDIICSAVGLLGAYFVFGWLQRSYKEAIN